jgi:hypothetical protein
VRRDVEEFLRKEGLAVAQAGPNVVFAYADGPRVPRSPVQTEWYLEFQFDDETLVQLGVEKRLIGP